MGACYVLVHQSSASMSVEGQSAEKEALWRSCDMEIVVHTLFNATRYETISELYNAQRCLLLDSTMHMLRGRKARKYMQSRLHR